MDRPADAQHLTEKILACVLDWARTAIALRAQGETLFVFQDNDRCEECLAAKGLSKRTDHGRDGLLSGD
ncbi:hypothetical protein [Paraburkholderia sp. HP33-1]|uniref:hypothetical protein n=1 Tax=Paraburkholderia sp. HP33-1 TaxID=2883243 RepID=UPI001F32B88E|nr:hypothetical protein [Paraburkholderia sp. HP33-1]